MLRFSASADIGAKAALRALHDLVADFLHHWMHVFFGYTEQQGGCFQWERLGAQAAMIRFESGTALLFAGRFQYRPALRFRSSAQSLT